MEGSFREDLISPPVSISPDISVVLGGAPDFWAESDAYSSPTPFSPFGPVVCSSGLELESWPSVVWDVNGYYWSLGVHFRATRRQLKDAYRARGGEDDAYLTYVFSQLLDPQIRRAYDAKPLGSVFWDKYVEKKVRDRAHQMAIQHEVDADVILRQWGFVDAEEAAAQEAEELRVDTAGEPGEDEQAPPGGSYTFYVWRTKTYLLRESDVRLARDWREAILDECYRHHVTARFAVGIMGSPRLGSDVTMLSVRGVTVLFVTTTVDVNEIAKLALIARTLLAS
jgi:hypothetical protein